MKISKLAIIASVAFLFSCKSTKIVEEIQQEIEEPKVEIVEEIQQEIEEPKVEIVEEIQQEIEEPNVEIVEEIQQEIEEPKVEIVEEIQQEIEEPKVEIPAKKELAKINMAKWLYNKENDVFYQLGISYCGKTNPTQKLSIYVPACYFETTKNANNTYTVHKVKGNPIYAFNIESKSRKVIPDSIYYKNSKKFMDEKRILVRAGGEKTADFKAAIRYLRYNAEILPNMNGGIFVYGEEKGAEYACNLGVSGDSKIFEEELKTMEAVEFSDSVDGVYATNPQFSFENENSSLDKKYLEQSIDRFFEITEFPFQSKIKATAKIEIEQPKVLDDGNGLFEGKRTRKPRRKIPNPNENEDSEIQNAKRAKELTGLFDTKKEYVEALNSLFTENWLKYDELFKTVEILKIEGFESILSHLNLKEEDYKDLKLQYKENPIYFLDSDENSKKAKYWVIKSAAFKSLKKSEKEEILLNRLKDSDCEAFLDLVWEKIESENLSRK